MSEYGLIRSRGFCAFFFLGMGMKPRLISLFLSRLCLADLAILQPSLIVFWKEPAPLAHSRGHGEYIDALAFYSLSNSLAAQGLRLPVHVRMSSFRCVFHSALSSSRPAGDTKVKGLTQEDPSGHPFFPGKQQSPVRSRCFSPSVRGVILPLVRLVRLLGMSSPSRRSARSVSERFKVKIQCLEPRQKCRPAVPLYG